MMKNKFVVLDQNKVESDLDSHIKLLVHGQGLFMFNHTDNTCSCIIYFYNKDNTDGLKIEFTNNSVNVCTILDNKVLIDKNNISGLSNLKKAYYWFNIDSQNQKLHAGIGEARLDNVIYQYVFSHKYKKFLEDIIEIRICSKSKSLKPFRLLRDPITKNIPLKIKNIDELTMNDIANSEYMPKANLSIISQKLYNCISGKKFILDDDDFPDFSKAIEYSIITPKMWCNKMLKKKSTEFNKDKPNILETYLRITLGDNNGESPGIPYVMEIWPIGHYSPIHNHSEANAIIRVLHGEINVSLYPFLCAEKDGVKPFNNINFKKDDITWISPTLNQTHKLMNKKTSIETCITIQCYMYETENTTHYDYFDYLDINGNILQYEPDSDMDFISFKNKMKEEWMNKLEAYAHMAIN
jgi:hypothetical protein